MTPEEEEAVTARILERLARVEAVPDSLAQAGADALVAKYNHPPWKIDMGDIRAVIAAAFAALPECVELVDECVAALYGRGLRPEQRREIVNEVFDVLSRKLLA